MQVSDFKAKTHQNSISAGYPPQTSLGERTPLPTPIAVFKGPTSKGREGVRRGEGKGRERKGESR